MSESLEDRRERLRREQDELAKLEGEEAARKAEEACREEQRILQEAEDARKRRREAIIGKIKIEIELLNPALQFTLTENRFEVVDESIPFSTYIDLNQKYDSGDRWRRRAIAGHYDIVVGSYGDRKRFPCNKEGNNKHDKIAAELITRYDEHVISVKRERARTANKNASGPIADRLREQFSLHQYGSVSVLPSSGSSDLVVLRMPEHTALTPDKAERLLTVLRELEIIK